MDTKSKIISLSAIGQDSPGLVSKITTRIFKMNGNILDVEENCRRGLFSIFLIIDFSSSEREIEEIVSDLDAIERETGLKVILGAFGRRETGYLPEKKTHIVTILGQDQPGIIAKISGLFHQYNINIESCRMVARGEFFSMEMVIDTSRMAKQDSQTSAEAIEKLRAELKDLCNKINQSVVIQSENTYKRMKKLVVFDVESSLIQDFSLREFLKRLEGEWKSGDKRIAFQYNNQDKMQSLIENARMLKGFPISDFERFGEIVRLNPGASELIRILKSMGFKIALLSSGFNFFIKKIFEQAGVDYAFSNTLKVDGEGITTGELEDPIITSETKNEILDFIMELENISSDQVIAVGDGSIGSHFIENVGLSIAFKPDDITIKTDGVFSGDRILNILYCLGIPQTELDEYLRKDMI